MLLKALLCTFLMLKVLAFQPPPEVQKIMVKCGDEFGINKDDILAMKTIPEDKKCYHKCVAENVHLMDKSGSLTVDEFKNFMKDFKMPDNFAETIEKCIVTQKSDPCDKAEEICNCFKEIQ